MPGEAYRLTGDALAQEGEARHLAGQQYIPDSGDYLGLGCRLLSLEPALDHRLQGEGQVLLPAAATSALVLVGTREADQVLPLLARLVARPRVGPDKSGVKLREVRQLLRLCESLGERRREESKKGHDISITMTLSMGGSDGDRFWGSKYRREEVSGWTLPSSKRCTLYELRNLQEAQNPLTLSPNPWYHRGATGCATGCAPTPHRPLRGRSLP